LAVSICVDFTAVLIVRVIVTVYCDNKLWAMLLSIASRPVGSTIVRRVPPLDRLTRSARLRDGWPPVLRKYDIRIVECALGRLRGPVEQFGTDVQRYDAALSP